MDHTRSSKIDHTRSSKIDPLHASLQDISSLMSPFYWVSCCPWLTISRDSNNEASSHEIGLKSESAIDLVPSSLLRDETLRLSRANSLLTRGFLTLDVTELPEVPLGIIELLKRGVIRLLELGHTASCISSYDEAWLLASSISPTVTSISGNRLKENGDWFSFAKSSRRLNGFNGPHRDKPKSGEETFSSVDGSADYLTVWIALSDATPSNSCLYFFPRDAPDVGYLETGDSMKPLAFKDFDAVVAQPCTAGSVVVFTHRVIHWGSRPIADQETRIAMSFALASPNFESGAFFSGEKYLPYPPLPLRISLTAGQAIAYSSQNPLTKTELALNTRMFLSNQKMFSKEYTDRISGDAQWLKFMRK